MIFLYILSFFITLVEVKSKEEHIPTLIWTSREFQDRKNVDYLVLRKIKSELFESYLMELLRGKKPLIVVFLENILSTDDFEWRNKNGDNSFPFLSNLTYNSRVDYFRSVESPHRTLVQLFRKGYKWKHLKPGSKLTATEGNLLLIEFPKIITQRPEKLRRHDQQIEELHRQLLDSGKSWISIYTARQTDNRKRFLDLKQMSPWHVVEPFQEKSFKALSIYRDEFSGFTLITKNTLQLFLPSPKNSAIKVLESCLGASAKPSKDKMDFVIWFPNYTLTFHLNQTKGVWMIEGAKLLNGNGDTLKLIPRQKEAPKKNKCYFQLTELQNEGKPIVKVTLSKYKFLNLQQREEECAKPYGFQLTMFFIALTILSAIICWNKLLQNWKFINKSKVVRISTENLKGLS